MNQQRNFLDEARVDVTATLSANPRSLYTLWTEYNQGIGGRKAAKYFNASERGRVKHKYCMRKPFWTLVAHMIRSGDNSAVAIEKIYDAYGQDSTTTSILRQIRADKGARLQY